MSYEKALLQGCSGQPSFVHTKEIQPITILFKNSLKHHV